MDQYRRTRDIVSRILTSLDSESPGSSGDMSPDAGSVPTASSSAVEGVTTEVATRFPTLGQGRSRYFPRRTYCPGHGPGQARRVWPVPYTKERPFTKEVVLVDRMDDSVPRGKKKSLLHDKNQVANAMDFYPSWTEQMVREKIEGSFKNALDFSKPFPRFEFLKACGSSLKLPNVGEDFKYTGERVKLLCGQGALYVRSLYPLCSAQQLMHVPPPLSAPPSPPPALAQQEPPVSPSLSRRPGLPGCSTEAQQLPEASSCVTKVTKREENMLLEMFPGKADRICGYIQSGLNAHEIVNWLADNDECDDVAITASEGFANILKEHATKYIDFFDDYVINTSRSCVWNSAQTFYKKALRDNQLLSKNLIIRFSGEEGVDAGALRNEFFEKVLQVINDNYFEGRQTKRLPKCHLGVEVEFEMIGLAIGHSLISGGPGFRCIHPAIVRFLLAEEPRSHFELPSIEDIPKNAQTEDLLLLIDELNKANEADQLDELVDVPMNMSIINGTNCPPTTPINVATRHQLLQHLILHEVCEKRRGAMTHISKGLNYFGLLPLFKEHFKFFLSVLTYNENLFSATELSALIQTDDKEAGPLNFKSHEFFMEYLKARELSPADASQPSLNDILSFWTGLREVPPMGFHSGLVVKYLPYSKKFELPRSHACFETIKLPVVHDTQQSFNRYMDRGVLESLGHFGLV